MINYWMVGPLCVNRYGNHAVALHFHKSYLSKICFFHQDEICIFNHVKTSSQFWEYCVLRSVKNCIVDTNPPFLLCIYLLPGNSGIWIGVIQLCKSRKLQPSFLFIVCDKYKAVGCNIHYTLDSIRIEFLSVWLTVYI